MLAYKVLKPDLTSLGLLGARPLQYAIGRWVRPGEPLSNHACKGGGLWVARRRCDALAMARYLLRKYAIRARIFQCRIGQVLYQSVSRIKTDRVRLIDEERVYWVLKRGYVVPSVVPGRYAGSRGDKIFGRLDCISGWRKMKKENRVFFLTYRDAIQAGYRPCKVCGPRPNDAYPLR